MTAMRFAFGGRVSTEDNQEPEASRARQLDQARRIIPPGAEIVEEYFDIGFSRSLPWPRRPETARLLADMRAGTNRWNAVVVGEFARAFGAPIQYSTIYPLFQHFGIELWLPEVGGKVDFNSATTEMLLGMLGSTSKQERSLIRSRVRDGMTVLARDGDRHLGGRPPYGYLLADAGDHPNPKKRALGQRLRRLEPDPVTAPVVERIFTLFVAGHGLKDIANILTADGVPSPSAHDPDRNPHRDPRGWAHTAIRVILRNEKYLGRAVWGKQARVEQLYDLDDVAAGYVTNLQWTPNDKWVYGPDDAHPPLVSRELWDAAQARIEVRATHAARTTRSPKLTTRPFLLRGLLHCGLCDRKMQGSVSHETLRYRCIVAQTRALPAYLAHHPKAVYVRQDAVVDALDRWLGALASGDWLAECQEPDPGDHRRQTLSDRLSEIDAATQNLVAAIETGTDPTILQPRITQLRAERELTQHELRRLAPPQQLTAADIDALLHELGGLEHALTHATVAEKTGIYADLRLRLTYQPEQSAVIATADLARVLSGVGRPEKPLVRTDDPVSLVVSEGGLELRVGDSP